jgi:hypothetical protein
MEAVIMPVRIRNRRERKTMTKMIAAGGAMAVLVLCAGCADPYLKDSATMGASGQFGAPAINVGADGKRHEYMVGSRIARESRESAESVKTLSRQGYKEGRMEKPGSSPLDGGG